MVESEGSEKEEGYFARLARKLCGFLGSLRASARERLSNAPRFLH